MKRMLMMLMAMALSAVAADVTGKWKATAEGPQGAMERTFMLKVDGEKLTGVTESSFAGKSEIKAGKIKGDALSFTIDINLQGNAMSVQYKGTVVSKDELKLTAVVGDNSIDWVAKRQ